jgi:predicted metal-binding protein
MTWITVCIHEKIQQEITPFAMFVWIESVDPCNATHARLTEARLQLIFKQRAVHDVNIDVSFFRMPKCARQSADNFETKLIPKMDRSRVRGDHEIELHAAKTHSTRLAQTVFGHSASHSGTLGVPCDHESGVGDV